MKLILSSMRFPIFKERTSTEPTTTPAADTDAPTGGAQKKKRGLGSFFKATEDTAAGPSPQQDQAIAFELQAYLQARPLDPEADPLEWRKASQTLYPLLSKLATKYLCIPATSAASERVFSTGGNVVTCLRSSLKPDQVNRLVFLAKNL